MTAGLMCKWVRKAASDWHYEVAAIGYPGPVVHGRPVHEPYNMSTGWVGFDYAKGLDNTGKASGSIGGRCTVLQRGKEWHWKSCLEPENEDGNSDGKRVPFCANEFPVRQLQTVDSTLASPTGFEPVLPP